VSVLEGAEAARRALEADAAFRSARFEGANGTLRVVLPASAADADAATARRTAAADASRCLAAAGLSLTHLAVEQVDLERAFMTLTEGKLA
jgi:hypothetical protein